MGRKPTGWIGKAAWLGATLGFASMIVGACTSQTGNPDEDVAIARSAVFTNGGFTTGTVGAVPPAPWVLTEFLNPYSPNAGVGGVTLQTPQTLAGLNLQSAPYAACATNNCQMDNAGVCTAGTCQPTAKTVTLQGTNVADPTLGAGTLTYCRYNNRCAIVNSLGANTNVNQLSQTMTIAAGDVDPTDGQIHVRFVVAPVLENPAHNPNEQPYFFVQLSNLTQGTVPYSNFNFSNQTGVPWKSLTIGAETYDYTDWQLIDIHNGPGVPTINMGDQVEILLIAAGCSLGGHFGELYVDGVGVTIPGLFVSGTGPTEVNPCTAPTVDPLTYTLTYKNGSAAAETGVVVTFNTPPNTTFASLNAPGLTCTNPGAGNAGAVTCTVGNLAAGASGSFTITVDLTCGTTGTITAGNFSITSTQEAPLLGNIINTQIGCTLDAQCATGDWCDEAVSTCSPTLANGTPIPSDPTHMNPTLNGACTPAAATLVCTSKVCDTDNACGYKNNDGTCTAATGPVVCRSGVCDPDGRCGYENGHGPCTSTTGGTVCRSGTCSVSGVCEPAGGCEVDADCTGGKWCDLATHTCTPQLANGQPIPTDPNHTNPTLNGTCTAPAATLVCVSGVCDTNDNECGYANDDGPCTVADGGVDCRSGVCDPNDGLCGYANGDGPCTMANGGVVCRSAMCSTDGNCEPLGGCEVDADCAATQYCNTPTSMCAPKVPNSQPVPMVPGHTPVLNGTCTSAAGASACVSGVCDTDNLCGYASGDGTCTMATGGTVCRSGTCSVSGVCEPVGGCEVDADCAAGTWCDEQAHMCVPTVANGNPVPTDPGHMNPVLNGTCTTAAGALTCSSGVCDTKDNGCGYANGDGPCNAGNGDSVCRSTICATSGPNAGTCVGCSMDSQCSGATPVCNTTTNTCVQCVSSTTCASDTPVCDATSSTCVPCNGNQGSSATDPCPTPGQPFCFLSGTMTGQCGMCTTDAMCPNGQVCNTTTGLCATGCDSDADCTSSQWCNNPPGGTGTCTAKVANGMPLPTMPSSVATCTSAVGMRVCVSGVCDTKDNECGYANGDGPCSTNAQCRDDTCDPTTMTCMASSSSSSSSSSAASSTSSSSGSMGNCTTDADCSSTQFCQGDNCVPQLPVGQACNRAQQCQGNDCDEGVCSSVIGSGNGVICAAARGTADTSGGSGPAALFGLMLAAAGLTRRRR